MWVSPLWCPSFSLQDRLFTKRPAVLDDCVVCAKMAEGVILETRHCLVSHLSGANFSIHFFLTLAFFLSKKEMWPGERRHLSLLQESVQNAGL
jgi:hypothetical protein